jgi:hypothetical protein
MTPDVIEYSVGDKVLVNGRKEGKIAAFSQHILPNQFDHALIRFRGLFRDYEKWYAADYIEKIIVR